MGKGPGFRGVCARSGVSETFWSRKSRSQWRDSGHSLSRRFFNVRDFSTDATRDWFASRRLVRFDAVRSTNPDVYSLCHPFRIETRRGHETARRRSQSDKIVIGDFSRGRAVALDPPKHEAEPVSGWRLSHPRERRRRRSPERLSATGTPGRPSAGHDVRRDLRSGDVVERCGLIRKDRLHPSA